jgi:hypothetical protein
VVATPVWVAVGLLGQPGGYPRATDVSPALTPLGVGWPLVHAHAPVSQKTDSYENFTKRMSAVAQGNDRLAEGVGSEYNGA